MRRRDAIGLLAALAAGSVLSRLGHDGLLAAARDAHAAAPGGDDPDAIAVRIADLIIPRTDTPGALDVGVPQFIARMLAGWYPAKDRAAIAEGLRAIDALAGPGGFLALPEAKQVELLTPLDAVKKPAPGTAAYAFAEVKVMTLYGYFTAERIQREVLHEVIIPGRWDPCIPEHG